MHRLQELVRLHRMETPCRQVASLLRMGPNTERLYRRGLEEAGLLAGSPEDIPSLEALKAAVVDKAPRKAPRQEVSTIHKWRDEIEDMMKLGAKPRAIFDYLRLRKDDFAGSLSAVKRMCARIRRDRGVQAEDVAIPVETDPGEIGQVDFGYAGKLYDPDEGKLRKAWVFVMVLGFSRHMFARIVFDQKVETWLRLHVEAFSVFGGVIRTVVPDNLKSAVIRAAFGIDEPTALNRSYRELARHYGFKVDPTPVRAPEKKGKVESGVKYVKGNFFKPRGQMDVAEANCELDVWVGEIAGQRNHGTTGKKPLEVFNQIEQATLLPLPVVPFDPVIWKAAKVHRDSHVIFERRLYSVPWQKIGREVWIRATSATVLVYCDDERIATHSRRGRGHRSTDDGHLPPHRVDLRHRSRRYWEQRADRRGLEVGRFIREVFESDDVLSQLRTVQAMVTHLETFPDDRARAACERARFFGNYTYYGLKNILRKALDLQPLPAAVCPAQGRLDKPRFARSVDELLQLPLEINDASN